MRNIPNEGSLQCPINLETGTLQCLINRARLRRVRERERVREQSYKPGGSLERRCLLPWNLTTSTPAMSSPTAIDNSTTACVFCRDPIKASIDYLAPKGPSALSLSSVLFFFFLERRNDAYLKSWRNECLSTHAVFLSFITIIVSILSLARTWSDIPVL